MARKISTTASAICFAIIFGLAGARLTITGGAPPTGAILPAGTTATMSCTTSSPWFLCIWEGPGGVACQCQAKGGGVSSMCQGYPRLSLGGSATECVATIANISPEDAGKWRCMLADQTDYATVTRNLDLGVGLAGVIGWVDGSAVRSSGGGGGGRLVVKENEEVELGCRLLGAYPAPTITIVGSDSLSRGRVSSEQSASAPGSQAVDVTQTARYRGNVQDNGQRLTCTAVQRDMAGVILYTSTVDLTMEVTGAAAGAALAIPIGGIIGIVLGILLLFLLCGLCAFFFLGTGGKRRQRAPKWVVGGRGIGGEGEEEVGGGGLISDEELDVDYGGSFIEARKDGIPSLIPVTHEVLVKGGSLEDSLNYDSNLKLGLGGQKFTVSKTDISAEALEKLLKVKDQSSGSSSDSSSSSSRSEKSKKGKKVTLQESPVDHGEAVQLLAQGIYDEHSGRGVGIAKYDTTIVYNGRYYEEEDFDKHLAIEKREKQKGRLGKRLKEKWKNNLLGGIQEGEQDDRPSEHALSSSSSSSGSNLDQVEAIGEVATEDEQHRIYQNAAFVDVTVTGGGRREQDSHQKQKEHEQQDWAIGQLGDEHRLVRRAELIQQQQQQEAENRVVTVSLHSSGSGSSSRNSSSLGHTTTTSGSKGRQFDDQHYYIGSSDYAEVVEEHVSGKYEDDLQYYEGKSKEMLEVETRIMTKEELLSKYYYIEEESKACKPPPRQGILKQVTQGLGMDDSSMAGTEDDTQRVTLHEDEEQSSMSPQPTLPTENWAGSDRYLASWIQTENLRAGGSDGGESVPSSPDSGLVQSVPSMLSPPPPLLISADREEQDRSDESVIVAASPRGQKMMHRSDSQSSGRSAASSSTASGSVYKHMADYLKEKQQRLAKPPHQQQQQQQRESEKLQQTAQNASREAWTGGAGRRQSSDSSSSDSKKVSSGRGAEGGSSFKTRDQQEHYSYSTTTSAQDRKNAGNFFGQNKKPGKQERPGNHDTITKLTLTVPKEDLTSQSSKSRSNAPAQSAEGAVTINKQYRITQQEIIFYLKKTDGVVKVVRRPLLNAGRSGLQIRTAAQPEEQQLAMVSAGSRKKSRRSTSSSGSSKCSSALTRHLSQPDLRRSPPRHADTMVTVEDCTYRVEQYESVVVHGVGGGDQLDYLDNVGLIHRPQQHHGPSHHEQVLGREGGEQWRSSGSIFDCELKCFQEPDYSNLPPCVV